MIAISACYFLLQVQYMFCDKTGTLTENKMIFKRCTIGGSDFAHKSFSRVSNLGIQSSDSSCVKDNQSGRAIIPVNPILSERLNSIDRQILINGTDTKITKDKQVLKISYLGSFWEGVFNTPTTIISFYSSYIL